MFYIAGGTGTSASVQTLNQPRAWYSLCGADLFAATPNAAASAQALGTGAMGTAGIGIQSHVLGNRHYELTNHLGNVLATVLDRVTPQLIPQETGTTILTGYSTDISSAQDYYPFGMLMPGRYISDNTPQCVTTQTTVLVPRIVRVYTTLDPVAPVRTTGGPIVVNPYPWGPVRSLPVAATFADQDVHLFNYLPADQHPDGWVGQIPAVGMMELDLSNEPTGISLYLPFGIDTSDGGAHQALGFEVAQLPQGARLEARVRHYPDENADKYNEVLRWRDVRQGEQAELRFRLPQGTGSAGKLVAELRFSAEGGAAQFGPMARVAINNPWIEKTEWVPENRLVTICEEKDLYRYGFNGMEKDNEVKGLANSLDFGARIYDPRIGRWLSLDPMAAKYPDFSPYNFVTNNPVIAIDPDGKDVHVVIGNKPVGMTTIRLIGSEDVSGAPSTVQIPVYELTVTDDVNKRPTTYLVTRDAPVIDEDDPTDAQMFPSWMGGDAEYNVQNTAFEPADAVGSYKLIPLEYPKGMGAFALRNPDGTPQLKAEPSSSKFRKEEDIALGVMIHVGGKYVTSDGRARITGSEGCFTLSGKDAGNKGINSLVNDINKRRSINKQANKGTDLDLKVEKREGVKQNYEVNESGEEVDRW